MERAELSRKCITTVSSGKHLVKQWIISISQYYPRTALSRRHVDKVNVYKTNFPSLCCDQLQVKMRTKLTKSFSDNHPYNSYIYIRIVGVVVI